jgi:hypothetical protein
VTLDDLDRNVLIARDLHAPLADQFYGLDLEFSTKYPATSSSIETPELGVRGTGDSSIDWIFLRRVPLLFNHHDKPGSRTGQCEGRCHQESARIRSIELTSYMAILKKTGCIAGRAAI